MTQWHRHTQEDVEAIVRQKHGDSISVTGEYIDARSPLPCHCNVCGTDWTPTFDNLNHGQGCPACGRQRTINSRRKSHDDFLIKLHDTHGDKFIPLSPYLGYDKEMIILCTDCQTSRNATPSSILHNGCPTCSKKQRGENRRLPQEDVDHKIYDAHNGTIEMLDPYTTAKEKKRFLCKNCNHTWLATPDSVMRGSGCPICASSYGEKCIRDYLTEKNIVFDTQVRFDDCRDKRCLPFDFLIGTKDNPICLIEYDGIQHFDPDHQFINKTDIESLEDIQKKDKLKNAFCKRKGIPLYRIKYIKGSRENIRNKILLKVEQILYELDIH